MVFRGKRKSSYPAKQFGQGQKSHVQSLFLTLEEKHT